MALPASRILELRNRLMQVPPERMRALILEGLRLGEEDIQMRIQAKARKALAQPPQTPQK
jgi:hypothetical protein